MDLKRTVFTVLLLVGLSACQTTTTTPSTPKPDTVRSFVSTTHAFEVFEKICFASRPDFSSATDRAAKLGEWTIDDYDWSRSPNQPLKFRVFQKNKRTVSCTVTYTTQETKSETQEAKMRFLDAKDGTRGHFFKGTQTEVSHGDIVLAGGGSANVRGYSIKIKTTSN